ncbi:MAG: putative Cl-channel, voltage gated [Ilumatobacteraceae bacterium]|nr:putative Cl-channel, voltage gated [Ilumatobacteraceae bacterium]
MALVLRRLRRAITSTLGTLVVAVLVAMVAGRCVAGVRSIIRWPHDGDRWWSVVVVVGALVSIIIMSRVRATGETTAAFVRALEDPPGRLRPVPARVAATATGIGLGTPLGLDGPALHLGGALGALVARTLHRSERAWTIAAGVAALSMAIDAPVAAALFAMEIGRRRTPRSRDIVPLVAGAFGAWLVRLATGESGGVLGSAANASIGSIALSAVTIGIICGVTGGWMRTLFARCMTLRWSVGRRLLVAGTSLALAVPIGWAATAHGIFIGSGGRMLSWARAAAALPVLAAALALLVLLMALMAADVVGGLLLPVFTLGGMIGLILARTWLPSAPLMFFVVAGGCALLAVAHDAPMTATALGFTALGWSAASWAVVASIVLSVAASGPRPERPR